VPLLNVAMMEFSRGSSAGIDAASSIAPYAIDVPRAVGGLYLIERMLPAGFSNSRNPALWSAGSGSAGAAVAGPDGTAGAGYRYSVASGGFSPYVTHFAGAIPGRLSIWRRRPTGLGNGTHQIGVFDTASRLADISVATETWERRTLPFLAAPTAAPGVVPVEGRALSTTPPTSGLAQDMIWDVPQWDVTLYVTSSCIAGTRMPDIATWPAYEVPTRLCTGRTAWMVRPIYASSELVDGDVRVIGSWGDANNVLRIRRSGTTRAVEAVVGGVVKCSVALTWAALDTLAVVVDPAAGTVSVNGVAGATGTAFAWPQTQFRLGGAYGVGCSTTSVDSIEFDGWLSIPVTA
jgi:hypothetical protein